MEFTSSSVVPEIKYRASNAGGELSLAEHWRSCEFQESLASHINQALRSGSSDLKERHLRLIRSTQDRYFIIFLRKKVGIGSTGAVYDALEIDVTGVAIEKSPLVVKAVFVDFFSQQEFDIGYDVGGFVDSAKDEVFSYVVMEKIDGGELFSEDLQTVHERLDSNLSVKDRLTMCIHILLPILSMHQKDIIHRDLKGSNILFNMFRGKPQVFVVDWGAAARLNTKQSWLIDEKDIGTPYMRPPESSKGIYTKKNDIYAAAAVLAVVMGGTPLQVYEDDKYDENKHEYPVGYDLCHFGYFDGVPEHFLFFLRSILKVMSHSNMHLRPAVDEVLGYFLFLYRWVDCFIEEEKFSTCYWDSSLPELEFNLNNYFWNLTNQGSRKNTQANSNLSKDFFNLVNGLSSQGVNLGFMWRSPKKMALMNVRSADLNLILETIAEDQKSNAIQICLSMSEVSFSKLVEYWDVKRLSESKDACREDSSVYLLGLISSFDQLHQFHQEKKLALVYSVLAKIGQDSMGISREDLSVFSNFFISSIGYDQLQSLALDCCALVSSLQITDENHEKRMPLVTLANYSLLGLDVLMNGQLATMQGEGCWSQTLYLNFLQAYYINFSSPLSNHKKSALSN